MPKSKHTLNTKDKIEDIQSQYSELF